MQQVTRVLGVALLVWAGCGDDGGGSGDDDDTATADAAVNAPDAPATPDAAPATPDAEVPDPDGGVVDPAGDDHFYVANTINVPTSASEANVLGIDLDGDGSVDNALGQIMATLAGVGADPQGAIDSFLENGEMLQLFHVKATDLVAATGVGVAAYVGQDADDPVDPSNNFSGTGMFAIQPDTPTDSELVGDVVAGRLRAGPDTMPLNIVIGPGTEPILVNLVGARVEADLSATNLGNAKLGGALTAADIDAQLIPGIAAAMQAMVDADCPGGTCAPGSAGETILGLGFDANDDGMITADELRMSALISSLLQPDVDLFDADGNFDPRSDGVNDSLSFGVGFTAVNAVFDLP